jgi:uncharacterized protein (TIGR00297 family)
MIETIFPSNSFLLPAVRLALGVVLALAVVAVAHRARLLNSSGAAAAALCGMLCVAGGWEWAILLIVYFAAASAVSWVSARARPPAMDGIVAKGDARDAAQVLANGGLYSAAAALTLIFPSPLLAAGALGALAASSSDTWATEIGVRFGGRPRSITTGTTVRIGESGGITGAGLVGSVAGAVLVVAAALGLGFSRGLGIALLVGGTGGSLADSLLGATVQEKRWCDACAESTERAVHLCGCTTRRIGGIGRLDNDVINLLSTFAGFLLAVLVYRVIAIA